MVAKIEIHQALHGYAEGHGLIGSSLDLDRTAMKKMAIMSDLGGEYPGPSFDPYITGYPLASAGWYVLARTWYAEEMPRPGCVWTHSLLISFPDLAQIWQLRNLSGLFRRPIAAHDFEPRPLSLDMEQSSEPRWEADGIAASIIELLYTQDAPVVLPATDSSTYEPLILAVWEQQWPRLRRIFSFSGASTRLRSYHRNIIDLQVMPAARLRSGRDLFVVAQPSSQASDAWVDLARRDLGCTATKFQAFLRVYGADLPAERCYFARLSRAFVALNEGLPTGEAFHRVVAELGTWGLEGRTGAQIVCGLLASGNEVLLPEISEVARLCAVLELELGDELRRELDFDSRVGQALKSAPDDIATLVAALAARSESNEATLAELLSALSLPSLARVADVDPSLCSVLVSHSSSIWTRPETWADDFPLRDAIFEEFRRRDYPNLDKVVAAMTAKAGSVFFVTILRETEKRGVFAVLDAVNRTPTLDDWLTGNQGRILVDRMLSHYALHWLAEQASVRKEVVSALVQLLPAAELRNTDVEAWSELFRTYPRAVASLEKRAMFNAFLLRCLLRSRHGTYAELACDVAVALARQADSSWLPNAVWRSLAQTYGWEERWYEKRGAKHIYRLLVHAFIRNHWPARVFGHKARASGVRKDLEKAAKRLDDLGGKRLLRESGLDR